MSVESVNNSGSNTGLYTTGAAVVGAGAGVAAGYLTKPFLKDGLPTDSFIKKIGENVKTADPEMFKEAVAEFKEILDPLKLDEASSMDDFFSRLLSVHVDDFETQKNIMKKTIQLSDSPKMAEIIGKIDKTSNIDELKAALTDFCEKQVSFDEFKRFFKKGLDPERVFTRTIFVNFWDSSKKQFVNCEEGIGAAVKKAARSIQGKYALIYGAIGAGVLGLGTLLCCGGKKSPQPVQKEINTQA